MIKRITCLYIYGQIAKNHRFEAQAENAEKKGSGESASDISGDRCSTSRGASAASTTEPAPHSSDTKRTAERSAKDATSTG